MRKLLNIALAAAMIGGTALAAASPAAAQDWRDRDGRYERVDRDRDHDRWRDRDDRRDWRGYQHRGWGRDCYTSWRWSGYWHRYVRVTTCD
jgi:Ni/Co efflux regulator RcnB